jgi:Uracil-DNA glycosylase
MKMNKYEEKLFEIDKAIHECNKCSDMVEKFGTSKTIHFGSKKDIVILGEAPANNGWRKSGIAWYDINGKLLPSGKVMDQLLNEIGYELMDTIFLEAIKCFPTDRKYLKNCRENCREYLLEQLYLLAPKVILTLGDTATKALVEEQYKKFSDVVGKTFNIKIHEKEIKVIPIFHPSPISPLSYKGNVPIFKELKKVMY